MLLGGAFVSVANQSIFSVISNLLRNPSQRHYSQKTLHISVKGFLYVDFQPITRVTSWTGVVKLYFRKYFSILPGKSARAQRELGQGSGQFRMTSPIPGDLWLTTALSFAGFGIQTSRQSCSIICISTSLVEVVLPINRQEISLISRGSAINLMESSAN